MNLANYMHLVPEIERRMQVHRIDTLVLGLGPTAHLVPWLSRSVLENVRIFGCHDIWRIMPVDDLVIMDTPEHRLAPGSAAHEHVVSARPKRLWAYGKNRKFWEPHLHRPMLPLLQDVPWWNWNTKQRDRKWSLLNDPPDTLLVSPTGTATLAWREGCRRIGIIGVEMRPGEHHTARYGQQVSKFFTDIAKEAKELGGAIVNLSPITALSGFEQWSITSESSSGLTLGSLEPVQNESLNEASEPTQASQ